jgi:hypothetical protein
VDYLVEISMIDFEKNQQNSFDGANVTCLCGKHLDLLVEISMI